MQALCKILRQSFARPSHPWPPAPRLSPLPVLFRPCWYSGPCGPLSTWRSTKLPSDFRAQRGLRLTQGLGLTQHNMSDSPLLPHGEGLGYGHSPPVLCDPFIPAGSTHNLPLQCEHPASCSQLHPPARALALVCVVSLWLLAMLGIGWNSVVLALPLCCLSAHHLLKAFGLAGGNRPGSHFWLGLRTLTLFFSQAASFSSHQDKAGERDDDEQAQKSIWQQLAEFPEVPNTSRLSWY